MYLLTQVSETDPVFMLWIINSQTVPLSLFHWPSLKTPASESFHIKNKFTGRFSYEQKLHRNLEEVLCFSLTLFHLKFPFCPVYCATLQLQSVFNKNYCYEKPFQVFMCESSVVAHVMSAKINSSGNTASAISQSQLSIFSLCTAGVSGSVSFCL